MSEKHKGQGKSLVLCAFQYIIDARYSVFGCRSSIIIANLQSITEHR